MFREIDSKPPEEKDFDLRLKRTPDDIQSMFYDLLAQERVRRTKEKKGRPEPVSLEDREEMLRRAKILAEGARRYGVNPLKQAKDWDSFKKPPTGGVKED